MPSRAVCVLRSGCELPAARGLAFAWIIEINFSFKVQDSEGVLGCHFSVADGRAARPALSRVAPLYGTPLAAPVILVARWGSPEVTKRMRTMNCLTPSSLRVVWMQTIASPSL